MFADEAGHAHARRWTHRQSARSTVGAATRRALVVTEAVHAGARGEVEAVIEGLASASACLGWSVTEGAVRG